jgi:sodium/hydrogen antiporter
MSSGAAGVTAALLTFGVVALLLTLGDAWVRRSPLSPALLYMLVGWLSGWLLGGPSLQSVSGQASSWVGATELAVLVSLFAVGTRLKVPVNWRAWKVALLMAGPGMVITILLGAWAGMWLLGLAWPAALLLAGVLAPTDPVLASEVQIRGEDDRDALRLSLSAEAGLNDGTALPGILLALALLGAGPSSSAVWAGWWWHDLLWPIGGGGLIGIAAGRLLGFIVAQPLHRGDPIARDELLFAAFVALTWGVARWTGTSAFVLVFVAAVVFNARWREPPGTASDAGTLSQRLHAFGARVERLIEVGMVLAVGWALSAVQASAGQWAAMAAFALVYLFIVRPVAVYAVVRPTAMSRHQRRLTAWFGIRGIGTLYYVAFVVDRGLQPDFEPVLVGAALVGIAFSVALHGVSATPLMAAYRQRVRGGGDTPR